ncbi:hypothetical protein HYQ00_gp72 [Arthrobacter phage TripleJ]|uniref:Uncharacterized protein n=1 Tax=Arthrobacter phage TripleJ TaxID=2599838 RepID=A0A5J6TFZ2_9CAUD|nr:hypothetical protein HYQ00_gp72 [Arthrobacter phage TripleJ]QFG09616.1 hypothetical protein PBI_TRIPLEJ_72 [Arthrobacter phage TripleJ]
MIIRAIPQFVGQGEIYFDTDKLTWNQRRDLKEELGRRGFYVQDIMLADPMQTLVEREVRLRMEAEQEKEQ